MVRDYDERPFDPEAPVARPKHHVYVSNPCGLRSNERRKPGITDVETLSELLEMDLESNDVESRTARDISRVNQEMKTAARQYEDAVDAVLLDWIQRNENKLNLGKGPLEDVTDDFGVLGVMAELGGGASYLYYIEAEGQGIGTWDGRWKGIFKNDNTFKELSRLVKSSTHDAYQTLNTAIMNQAFELMQEHGLSMEENPRKKKATRESYYAQPYSVSATGFYFGSLEEFNQKFRAAKRRGVEEFELQFIDGSDEDADLFKALEISQATIDKWFEEVQPLEELEKVGLFALFYHFGERNLDKAIENVKEDNPIVFEGNVKEYAENHIDDIGGVKALGEQAQLYFDYESYGSAIKNDILTSSDDEEEQERVENMSDRELGEQYADDLGWEGVGEQNLQEFFDMDKFANDLELGTEIEFAGKTFIFDNNH
jgi:hypothetical protein